MSSRPLYDLARFSLLDMTECSASLRALGDGARSMQGVAQQAVRFFYNSFRDAHERQACALVRFFKTHAYCALPPDLQTVARSVFAGDPISQDVACITLMATTGEQSEWNATEQSRHHRAIPMIGNPFSARFPMFSQLFRQVGIPVPVNSSGLTDALVGKSGQSCDVFYVSDALGSPLVTDQQTFVIPYGVRSVLGFGGALPSGDVFAVVLFSKVKIQRQAADLFKTLTISLKLALLPFDGGTVFDGVAETAPTRRRASDKTAHLHRSPYLTTLEELLTVQEQTVAASSARRRGGEEALVDTSAKLSSVVDSARDVIVFIDQVGAIRSWSEQAEAMFGYATPDIWGKPSTIILPYGFLDAHATLVKQALDEPGYTPAGTSCESVGRRKDGTCFPVDVKMASWRGKTGMVCTAIIHNSTERRVVEAPIARSESRLRSLIQYAPDAIFTLSLDGIVTSVNPAFEAITEWKSVEWIGKPFTTLVYPEDRALVEELFRLTMKDEAAVRTTFRIESKSRGLVTAEFVATPQIEDGDVVGLLAIARDITDRKHIEEALRESEARLRSIVDSSGDGILSINDRGVVIFWNKGAEAMFGYVAEEIVGRDVTAIIPERFRTAHGKGLLRAAGTGKVSGDGNMRELIGCRKDGTEFPIEFSLATWSARGETFFTGIIRDVSDRNRVDQALQALAGDTATAAGEDFFRFLVSKLASALNVRCVLIGELNPDHTITTRALWVDGRAANNVRSEVYGTPNAEVLEKGLYYDPKEVRQRFPNDALLRDLAAESYCGSPIHERSGRPIGVLAALHDKPWHVTGSALHIMTVFAARAGLELERRRAEDALRDSQARLTKAQEIAHLGSYEIPADSAKKLHWSDEVFRILGREPGTDLASPQEYRADIVHPDDRIHVEESIRDALAGTAPYNLEYRVRLPQGGVRWVHSAAETVRDDEGNVIKFVGTLMDITERKMAELALRESEERYRSVIETAGSIILVLSPDSRILEWNREAESMYGRRRDEVIGRDVALCLPSDTRGVLADHVEQVLAGREIRGIETPVCGRDRRVRVLCWNLDRLVDSRGQSTGIIAVAQDITERKKAEEQLHNTLNQVRTLSGRVEVVREEERARIARELHDELGVGLTCLKIDLSRLQSLVGDGSGPWKTATIDEKIRSMMDFIDTQIVAVQRIVTELRPPVLDDLGLLAALEWQAQDFEHRTGVRCTFSATHPDLPLDSDRASMIFRICQEALTNVARHARATEVDVSLKVREGTLLLQIRDNGRGVPDEKLFAPQSLGLLGMRERADLFGGHVSIIGQGNLGTTVSVALPYGEPQLSEGGS